MSIDIEKRYKEIDRISYRLSIYNRERQSYRELDNNNLTHCIDLLCVFVVSS